MNSDVTVKNYLLQCTEAVEIAYRQKKQVYFVLCTEGVEQIYLIDCDIKVSIENFDQ